MPRRWSVEFDGIRWLPRMIDKARMSAAGKLGPYWLGQAPADRALLSRLGLSTQGFVEIVAAQSNDEGVLNALRRHGFDEARVRRWSDHFDRTYRWLIPLWDVDEGYTKPNAATSLALKGFRMIEGPLFAFLRKVVPAP